MIIIIIIIIYLIFMEISNRRLILLIYFYLNIFTSFLNKVLNSKINYFVILKINIKSLLK